MESLVLFLIGAGALIGGCRLLVRARRPTETRGAIGGAILVIAGAILLIAGFWSAGTLVGEDGTTAESSVGETEP